MTQCVKKWGAIGGKRNIQVPNANEYIAGTSQISFANVFAKQLKKHLEIFSNVNGVEL